MTVTLIAPPRSPAPEPPPARPEPVVEHVDTRALFGETTRGLPAVEWYRGATRASGPIDPSDGRRESADRGRGAHGPGPAEGAPARAADVGIGNVGDMVGSMLRADALTGLAGLPSVLVHLGGAVATLHASAATSVAVVLVDVRRSGTDESPVSDGAFSEVAQHVCSHVRNGDLVGRIGDGTIAVIANVRSGRDDGAAIERRLVDAARQALQDAPGSAVRSALTTALADTTLGPEELLRQAIARLAAW